MMRRWEVCVDPAFDPDIIEADRVWYSQETGWLSFQRENQPGHFAAFAPGKWAYFKEVSDGGPAR